ncbi:hypothetical protein [Oceanirhabdus sp. W0125-5]|uniref:hypothetical protein n=1 Tax=Oceanirhabdus sp. W0125-5 TaxID=2999116 RepID=UPI0022F2D9C5|nr:hypothetical protein [Oceanirhabdus sp. W0125-5]WBW97515.1 hypothetical protein OW730_01405 [Oceanirhabdus sp. W0125-5]
MDKQQNVFYVNIISGYLERFVKDNIPSIVYFSKELMLVDKMKLHTLEKGELVLDYMELAEIYSLPITFMGFLWTCHNTSGKDKFAHYNPSILKELKDTGIYIPLEIHNQKVIMKIWTYTKGDIKTILIDCNIEENSNEIREITTENYKDIGNDKLLSDILIGIGGVTVLNEMKIIPEIYHFNGEYVLLSIAKLLTYEPNINDEVINNIIQKCVTTIHDVHIKTYNISELEKLIHNKDIIDLFKNKIYHSNNIYTNILINCKRCNGVSVIQEQAIRKRVENEKVKEKLVNIVNGVFLPKYLDKNMLKAFKNKQSIFDTHIELKNRLINYIYTKTFVKLKSDKLIIGVVATSNEYERWNLILRDKEKLFQLLEDDKVQLVFYVQPSKLSLTNINFKKYISIKKKYPNNIIFLNDLDSKLQKYMLSGCDVWLNNSKIPQDSCGVSRIKAAINGVLNFSTLNGCWPEVCVEGINGWQIGSGVVFKNSKEQDQHDLESLYEVLNTKIITMYYNNTQKWEDMIIQSIKSTMEYFCIERILIEYYDNLYK